MAAQDNSRGLHPGQFAPMGGKLRLRLCKRIAHVRGGCTPGNSRLWVLIPSGDQDRPSRQARRSLPLVLIEPLAHVRGGVPPLSIRANGRQATLAPVQEDSARARGLHPRQFAPGGGDLRSRLYEPLAHVRGGGIFRTKEPGRQFQGRGAAGSIKQKEKRPWQTPLAFSL